MEVKSAPRLEQGLSADQPLSNPGIGGGSSDPVPLEGGVI